MKKILLILCLFSFTGCATVLSGKADSCQTTKPQPQQPARKLRAGYFIADVVLFPVGLVPDFITGKIYKPCNK